MKNIALFVLLNICSFGAYAQLAPPADTLKFNANKKDLSTFINAVNIAGLGSIFTGTEPLTLLAPDNRAFEKLPAGALDTLLKPANKTALTAFINNHILNGKLSVKEISRLIKLNNGQTPLVTLGGTKLIAQINANRNLVLVDDNGNENVVKRFDIPYGNVVLFVISSVIFPK